MGYSDYIWDPVALRWINLSKDSSARILYGSTEYWASKWDLMSEKGTVYICTDYRTIEDEHGDTKYVQSLKIGDGTSYVVDLPVVASSYDDIKEQLDNHIRDNVRHITSSERTTWNSKLRVEDVIEETLVLG